MMKIRNKFLNGVKKGFLKFRNFNPENCILMTSDARSGSTWLMETIQRSVSTVIHWEPLHVEKGTVPREMRLGWKPFIPEFNEQLEYKELFSDILSAKTSTDWTIRYSSISDVLFAKNLLVKEVRGSLMLPWLVKNFNFKHKPILLVRHPVAVGLSQIAEFHKNHPTNFGVHDAVFNERYILHYDFVQSLETLLEKTIAFWCIRNIDPLEHPLNNKAWTTVYYEDLLLEPEMELKRIFRGLNIDAKIKLDKIGLASKSNYNNKYKTDKIKQLSKWKDSVSEQEKLRIQMIFDHFKFKNYNVYDIMPTQKD